VSKRWKAILLALVPGLGHLYLGRHWRGLGIFAVFAFAVNGMFIAFEAFFYTAGAESVFMMFQGGAVSIWAYSVLHVAYLTKQFERAPVAERKDYHLKRGLTQYLAGSFDTALDEFNAVLKLDPMDIDARFHLGMTHKALGHQKPATKAFKRCLADDMNAKWRWEIEVQLKELKGAS
jgi:tetratricopeptide (TPR) repeat protein